MLIEDAKGMQLAMRNLRILRAERAGFGEIKDDIDKAMIASLDGQIISIETDIRNYEQWHRNVTMGRFNPEVEKDSFV